MEGDDNVILNGGRVVCNAVTFRAKIFHVAKDSIACGTKRGSALMRDVLQPVWIVCTSSAFSEWTCALRA